MERANGGARFRRLTLLVVESVGDLKRAGLRIEVFPAQGKRLADPNAGQGNERKKQTVGCRNFKHEFVNLLGREHGLGFARVGGAVDLTHRRSGDQIVLKGHSENGAQEAVEIKPVAGLVLILAIKRERSTGVMLESSRSPKAGRMRASSIER